VGIVSPSGAAIMAPFYSAGSGERHELWDLLSTADATSLFVAHSPTSITRNAPFSDLCLIELLTDHRFNWVTENGLYALRRHHLIQRLFKIIVSPLAVGPDNGASISTSTPRLIRFMTGRSKDNFFASSVE
jgi:hypothetical protein